MVYNMIGEEGRGGEASKKDGMVLTLCARLCARQAGNNNRIADA